MKKEGKLALLVALVLVILYSLKKGGEINDGSTEAFTIGRLSSNLKNLFTFAWWGNLWERAALLTYVHPSESDQIIANWQFIGATADQVLTDKVNTGFMSPLEGYQYLVQVYDQVITTNDFPTAKQFAANQLQIYSNTVNYYYYGG